MKKNLLYHFLQIFCLSIGLFACHKAIEEQKTHSVTYTLYSTNPDFNFIHAENGNWTTDVLKKNTHSLTVSVVETDFSFIQRIENNSTRAQLDSFNLRADMDGKTKSIGFSYFNAHATCSIQLSELK